MVCPHSPDYPRLGHQKLSTAAAPLQVMKPNPGMRVLLPSRTAV